MRERARELVETILIESAARPTDDEYERYLRQYKRDILMPVVRASWSDNATEFKACAEAVANAAASIWLQMTDDARELFLELLERERGRADKYSKRRRTLG